MAALLMKQSGMFLSICRKSGKEKRATEWEVLMEKKEYVLLPVLIVCCLISGGCGSAGETAERFFTKMKKERKQSYEDEEKKNHRCIFSAAYVGAHAFSMRQ